MIEDIRVRQVTDDQPVGRHGGTVAERQVVINGDVVTAGREQAERVAADVSGSAGDKDAHLSVLRGLRGLGAPNLTPRPPSLRGKGEQVGERRYSLPQLP